MIGHFFGVYFAKIIRAFFRALSSPRRVLGFVIMTRNLEQNNELAELILTDGSDLEDDFSDSSLKEDFSDESDSLESLPSGESSFLEGAFRSPPPCDLSSRLVDNDEVKFSSFPRCIIHPYLL